MVKNYKNGVFVQQVMDLPVATEKYVYVLCQNKEWRK